MTQAPPEGRCPLCGGRKAPGTTTYTVDFGDGLVVVRDVPAAICAQCGEEWIADETARRLEAVVERARNSAAQVEIATLAGPDTGRTVQHDAGSAYG